MLDNSKDQIINRAEEVRQDFLGDKSYISRILELAKEYEMAFDPKNIGEKEHKLMLGLRIARGDR